MMFAPEKKKKELKGSRLRASKLLCFYFVYFSIGISEQKVLSLDKNTHLKLHIIIPNRKKGSQKLLNYQEIEKMSYITHTLYISTANSSLSTILNSLILQVKATK